MPAPPPRALSRPAYRSARRKVVIIGNCQSETLRQGFARIETLNRLFEVKYHFIQLPKNLHEFAARDLETCDIVPIQDIRLWDEFPLRDCVRPGAEARRFPLVRFASPWPFDAWNGPGDKRGLRARGAEPDFSVSRRSARPPARGHPRPGGPVSSLSLARSAEDRQLPPAARTRDPPPRRHGQEVRLRDRRLYSGKFPEQGGYFTRPCGRTGRCSTC